MKKYDVLIIGGGLLGCFAAYCLGAYNLTAAVLEAREDVCTGISRGNTAIVYPGYDTAPGTLKTELCVSGCNNFDALCDSLGVSFNRCGSIMAAFGNRGDNILRQKYARGIENGVHGMRLISGSEARQLEPSLSQEATTGLFCSQSGTVLPWELGIAAFENAKGNGVDFLFNEKVLNISKVSNGFTVDTSGCTYETAFIINCAGLFADELREMLFNPMVRIIPTGGDYLVFDPLCSGMPGRIIFCEPEEKEKGLTIVPTVTGTLLAGPSETPRSGKHDLSTSPEGLDFVQAGLKRFLPGFDSASVIRSFSALRPNPYYVTKSADGSFIVEEKSISNFTVTRDMPNFLSFIGIKTPGLTCCHGLGALAARAAAEFLSAEKNPTYSPVRHRPPVVSELSADDRNKLIEKDPTFGRIVCRCRGISEGEIISAIRRGAVTLDGIKRRTDAGSGRCQGSFCAQRIMEIMAAELHVPVSHIMKDGRGAYILEGANERI